MQPTVLLIAKLSKVDPDVARRAIGTARSQDDPDAPLPHEFTHGRGALAYALAQFIWRKPLHFVVGGCGLIIFPVYLLLQLGMYIHGR